MTGVRGRVSASEWNVRFFRGTSWLITQFGNVLAGIIVNDVGLSCATVNTTRLARGTFGNFKFSFRLKNSAPFLRHVRH